MSSAQSSIAIEQDYLSSSAINWLSPGLVSDPSFTEQVSNWLLDSSSLTNRLRDLHGENFNLKLLNWQQERPLKSEIELLNSAADSQVWVRQVVLRNSETPLVFARSVMIGHDATLMKTLSGLGCQSLGDYLFNTSDIIREEMQIAKLGIKTGLLRPFIDEGLTGAESRWARRCVYKIGLARLLVNEVYSSSIFWSAPLP